LCPAAAKTLPAARDKNFEISPSGASGPRLFVRVVDWTVEVVDIVAMPSSVPAVLLHRSNAPPADWRERILAALASEGVTQPPHTPVWRMVLANLAKILWLMYLNFLPLFLVLPVASRLSDNVGVALVVASIILIPIIFFGYTSNRLRVAGRRSRVEWRAINATYAVSRAQHPPIFYLRSFGSDDAADRIPLKHWVALTPEMTLILRMRSYAPVLAIAKPNDTDAALGALRFHVTDARWEDVVKAIVPCCALVVWMTGNTPGLNWEIEHLVSSLAPHRLLLWPHANVDSFKALGRDWRPTARQRNAEWQQFVDAHIEVFPKALPRDITATRFIAFDADWTPIPIPSPRYPARRDDFWVDPKGFVAGLQSFLDETFGAKNSCGPA
jgi:hypothetical protein